MKCHGTKLVIQTLYLAIGIIALVVPVGCGGKQQKKSDPVSVASNGNTSNSYVLASTSKVISASSGTTLISESENEIVFGGLLPEISSGDKFVSQLGSGRIYLAQEVTSADGKLTVKTAPIPLTEFVEQTHFVQSGLAREDFGEIESNDPKVKIDWVSSAPRIEKRAKTRDLTLDIIRVSFDGAEISSGASINGTAYIRLNPTIDLKVSRAPGDLLPTTERFAFGVEPQVSTSLTMSRNVSGSVTLADKVWYDKPVGKPIVLGYLVFVPRLKISSVISGSTSGSMLATSTFDYQSKAKVIYERGRGWSTDTGTTRNASGDFESVNAAFAVEAGLLSVEYSYSLYGTVGPSADLTAFARVVGEVVTNPGGEEGVWASLKAGLNGGVTAINGGFFDRLGLDFSLGRIGFDAPLIDIGSPKFFPFTGSASIMVADNGPAPDDVFEVYLDGTYLGKTTLGGSGQFRVENLRPGTHELSLKAIEGAGVGFVATYGVTLANGITFLDGSDSRSGTLDLNEVVTYDIVVPEASERTRSGFPVMPRNLSRRD